ncbi:TetR/AcrR family transcriptional regulator [Gordonia polyisoprenivorans]|uniref:TetR/AcrR family transcriptional regulator n=1 Tax=Gordonia polyisoprenivorans TaxID=84595 RepID=UPI000B99EA56|nr:TetR family transcriptional regulator [Gordonia polyisoprenivorans]
MRNRAKLIEAARDAFTAGEGDITFDALARRAGVGVGTLYRNFATRQALVEAVYRSELDDVVHYADGLLEKRSADETLRHWLDRYATFVATKHGMAEAFTQAIASGAVVAGDTRERIGETLERILAAGAEDGTLRTDVRADDAVVALLGVFLGLTRSRDDAQRRRVLDLYVDALRPRG